MTLPHDMLAIVLTSPGGPEMLEPRRVPLPALRPGEVLIKVAAAGINAPDLGQRRGSYPPPPDASPLLGLEVSGIITALGPSASGFAPGDEVVALVNGGGYAEYVAVPAGQVLPLPRNWTLPAGAALPETFFTIAQTLLMRAGLSPGMDLLIHGAAGGIGGSAIQIGRALGARLIAVVSDASKAAYVESLGVAAKDVIVHMREDFVARTRELTGGKGADRIIEMAGGPTLAGDIEAAARGGHIVILASLSGEITPVSAGSIVMKQLTLSGSTLRPQPPEVKAEIAARLRRDVWPALEDGRIVNPRIAFMPIEDVAIAHGRMEQRAHYGKLLLLTAFGRSLPGISPAGAISN